MTEQWSRWREVFGQPQQGRAVMAEYGKLFASIWSDPDFTALPARAQQIYAMLCSHPTRNLAGVLPLTLKRWAKSTADATVDNVTDALHHLAANKFVVIDWDTEEVLIRTFIRNDEVYRQPNLMKAARRFALQVESEALRWALHDELSRLPEHKEANETAEVAKCLVERLKRASQEPLPEPFDEPLPEPPGVGGYLSGVRAAPEAHTQHLQPTDDTAPRCATSSRFDDFWDAYPRRRDRRKAEKAFANAIKRADPDRIIAGAHRYAADPNRVDQFTKYAEGWLNGDGWLDEPLPPRNGSHRVVGGSPVDDKVNGWLELANQQGRELE